MAMWSPELTGPGDANAAIQCALKLALQVPTLAVDGRKFTLRIGLHSGPVVVGLVGAETRRDYHAIGPNVRLAAGLCAMAMDGQVLCTQETVNRSGGASGLKPIPLQTIEGFGAPQMVYLIGAAEGEEISLDL
jgi:adenylate cyclase